MAEEEEMEGLRDEMKRLQEQLRREQRKPQVGCVISAFINISTFSIICYRLYYILFKSHISPLSCDSHLRW